MCIFTYDQIELIGACEIPCTGSDNSRRSLRCHMIKMSHLAEKARTIMVYHVRMLSHPRIGFEKKHKATEIVRSTG